jgi:hypothetical protein
MHCQTSVKWKAEGWGGALGTGQCRGQLQNGKGRRGGRLLVSRRAPLEPQPHCMQHLILPSETVHGKAVGRRGVGQEPCPPPSNDELSCAPPQPTRRLRSCLTGLSPLVEMASYSCPAWSGRVRGSTCMSSAVPRARCLPGLALLCCGNTLSPPPLPLTLRPWEAGPLACSRCVPGWLTVSAPFLECAERVRPSVSRPLQLAPSLLGSNPHLKLNL